MELRASISGLATLLLSLLLAGLLLILPSGCGQTDREPAGNTFDVAHTSDELERATVEISGRPPGEVGLKEVEVELRTSVREMSKLTEEEYVRAYDRSPQEQASLVGTWLGLASNELTGREQRVSELTAELSAAAPNERSDNPDNPSVENARSQLQGAYALARQEE